MSDSDPALFERMVLLSVDQFRDTFQVYGNFLCRFDNEPEWIRDFEVPVHNAIYRCIHDYHKLVSSADNYKPIGDQLLRAFLTQQAANGSPDIGMDEIDEAVEYMKTIRDINQGVAVMAVSKNIVRWLTKRRMNEAMRRVMQVDGWDPEVMMSATSAAVSNVRLGEGEKLSKFGDGLDRNLPPKKRYPIPGMNEFNMIIGGGFAHGELSLFIAPTGGGKTVLALQIAVGLALQNLHVLFITTEQRPIELEPRIISAWCQVPFDTIRDGVEMNKLAGFQREAIAKLRTKLDGKLWFEDWSSVRNVSIQDDLDNLIMEHERRHGKLDAIVFDWMGGALGELSRNDMHVYRLLLHNTGEVLGKLADIHDIIVVSFAQAALKQAWNKKKVDATMIGECKSLGNKAENIHGISCMLTPDANLEEVEESFLTEQYLYTSKSRKSSGKGCKLYRDFAFQRFTDRRAMNRPVAQT